MVKAITDKYEMTEARFWELVAQADWPKNGYYNPKILYLSTLNEKECSELRSIAGELWKMLDEFIGKENNPANGGDDSHSDLLYHIIGLGKKVFYANLKDYDLIRARGSAPYSSEDGYEESFVYCLPYDDETKDPKKSIEDCKRSIKQRAMHFNNVVEIDGKEYKADEVMGFDMLMQHISDTLCDADGEFVSEIYNRVCSDSIEHIGDDTWRMK
jgi:hypothetical protein